MPTSDLEFSRRIPANKLEQPIELTATAAECAAIAKRLDLRELTRLEAKFTLTAGRGGLIFAQGKFLAEVVQSCVVTLEPVPARIEEDVDFLFSPHPPEVDEDDPEAEIIEPIINGQLELGEPLVQTLALCLDPYPRQPGVEFSGFEV